MTQYDSGSVSGQIVLPDYQGGSIANLMASLMLGLGASATGYPPLRVLDVDLITDARAVALVVIDGLGYQFLQKYGADSRLGTHCLSSITSVCPSTTASAIPTFLTGVPPQQHGFTGWFTYFSELGSVLTVLPFRSRLGNSPVDVVSPLDLSGAEPLFERLQGHNGLVMPERIAKSVFNKAFSGHATVLPYDDLHGFENALVNGISRFDYTYAYWPEFDALAHEFGVESPEVKSHFWQLDETLGSLMDRLQGTDTLLLVTADHGFIDTTAKSRLRLEQHPQLAETLLVPPCGEPRLSFCYTHPDRQQQFEDYVRNCLVREISLYSSSDILQQGWFGLGKPHLRLRDRIGHYTLVMNENYTLTSTLPGEKAHRHVGVHGGLSAAEMLVPLACIEC